MCRYFILWSYYDFTRRHDLTWIVALLYILQLYAEPCQGALLTSASVHVSRGGSPILQQLVSVLKSITVAASTNVKRFLLFQVEPATFSLHYLEIIYRDWKSV
jgi:hypothetical protein